MSRRTSRPTSMMGAMLGRIVEMRQRVAKGTTHWPCKDVEHNGDKALTLLELMLRLEGEFRRSLKPIRVTPLQSGVILFLRRHTETKVTDAAAALGVRLSTMSVVVKIWYASGGSPGVGRSRIHVSCIFGLVGGVRLLPSRLNSGYARWRPRWPNRTEESWT
jgi:hypothetical protein